MGSLHHVKAFKEGLMTLTFKERQIEREEAKKKEEVLIEAIENRILEYLKEYNGDSDEKLSYQVQRLLEYHHPPNNKEYVARCFEKAKSKLLSKRKIREDDGSYYLV